MRRIFRFFIVLVFLCLGVLGYYLYQAGRQENVKKVKSEKKENVYIEAVSGSSIQVFEEGEKRNYQINGNLDQQVIPGVADLIVSGEQVEKIYLKPDTVSGRVLLVDDNGLELENYGRIEFEKSLKVYRLENGVEKADFANIVVGYTNTRFVVANGKIQSALIDKPIEQERAEEKIRVMIMTDNFSGYEHSKVVVSGTKALTVTEKGMTKTYKRGEKVELSPEQKAVVMTAEGGKIRLHSVKRQNRCPIYRGVLEIRRSNSGYHIINELPLEKYLYSVVSSEMPTTYGIEALKAQAVCARSYGRSQIKENKLRRYGAHVDDSVSYQVYNNIPEDKASCQAVDETKGEVVAFQGKIATTYFYSTSCGSASSSKDVWYTKDIPYLTENRTEDFSGNDAFTNFIQSTEKDCYDKAAPWYRWKVTLKREEIEKQLEAHINKRYETNPTYIRVKKGNKYTAGKPGNIGTIQKIFVVRRAKSGLATTLEVKGSKKTVRIYSEYNIRLLLAGKSAVYKRKNGSDAGGLNLLPSGFFTIEQKKDNFILTGGGFGHGVGMSQCGANAMAQAGKTYRDIILFYYPTTEVLQDIR